MLELQQLLHQLLQVGEKDRVTDFTSICDCELHQIEMDLRLPDRFSQSTFNEASFHVACLTSLVARKRLPSYAVDPINQIDALLQSFGARQKFGEEDPSVEGAGIIVPLVERVEPIIKAAVAHVMSTWHPLDEDDVLVLFLLGWFAELAEGVVGVVADWAVAFVLGNVGEVDVGACLDEG